MSMRTSIIIDLAGNLERRAKRYTQAIHRMSRRSSQDLRLMSRAGAMAGRGIDKLGNRYTAAGLAAGLAASGKQVMDLQRRFTRLGIQSGKTVEEMDALKKKIFEIASAPDISIDPTELLAAFEEIVNQTGNLPLAEENLRNLALAIQAAGAAGKDVGALMANYFEKFGIHKAKEALAAFDLTINQGKAGSLTFANLSTQANRVTAAYASMGRTGVAAVREMGAMLQVVRKGVSGPEQASTAFEAYINTLNDAKKRKLITATGVKLIDPDDPKRMRSIVDITKELIVAAGGDISKLGTIFDSEARRALLAVATEYKQTGGFASLDRYMQAQSNGVEIMRDSARAAHDAAGAMQNLYTAWKAFADSKLTEPIQALADALNKLGSNNFVGAAASGVLGLGAAVVGRKIYKAGKAGTGALVQAGTSSALKRTGAGALARTGARVLAVANPVGGVLTAGLTAYELASALEKAFIGGSLGEWIYDVTHSKVDVNINLNHEGRPKVTSVKTQGLAGEANIDTGPIPVGAN